MGLLQVSELANCIDYYFYNNQLVTYSAGNNHSSLKWHDLCPFKSLFWSDISGQFDGTLIGILISIKIFNTNHSKLQFKFDLLIIYY